MKNKNYVIFFGLFLLLLSCSKEPLIKESYIGNFSKEFFRNLKLSTLDDESEKKEIIKYGFEKMLSEKKISSYSDIKILQISDDFVAFSILLQHNDMLKLQSDSRIESIGPDGQIGI